MTAEDVAKRLMDYGFHAPTLSFPVAGTLMVAAARIARMILDQVFEHYLVRKSEVPDVARHSGPLLRFREHRLELDHGHIAVFDELALFVEDAGDAARHAPAAKFRPVAPSTTTVPPVMCNSQP